jgi:hypothetical protein
MVSFLPSLFDGEIFKGRRGETWLMLIKLGK